MVYGTAHVKIKKEYMFWSDGIQEQDFSVNLAPGEEIDLVLQFIPDEASGLLLKGYFVDVTFTGEYLLPGVTLSNYPVNWDDGSVSSMKSSYPPRLKVEEEGSIAGKSGTLIHLREVGNRLYLHVYDHQNRHVGLNRDTEQIENEIPGAEYFDNNEKTTYIALPSEIFEFRIVIDSQNAEESVETYNLSISKIKELEVIQQENITSTIKKGVNQEYNTEAQTLSIQYLIDTDEDNIPDIRDQDDDNDGITDTWEIEHKLNPKDSSDANLDPDQDGLNNLEESEKDTNPHVYEIFSIQWWVFPIFLIIIITAIIYYYKYHTQTI
jgi:hypothetical protein